MLPSPPPKELDLRDLNSDEATLSSPKLRPDDSRTILSDGFVSQLHPRRFLHECDSSYGALTFAPMGLIPTEQTCLRWTHWVANY
jgi:hypothetical protein